MSDPNAPNAVDLGLEDPNPYVTDAVKRQTAKPAFVYPPKSKDLDTAERVGRHDPLANRYLAASQQIQPQEVGDADAYDRQVAQAWADYQNAQGTPPEKLTTYPSDYTPSRRLVNNELSSPASTVVPPTLNPESTDNRAPANLDELTGRGGGQANSSAPQSPPPNPQPVVGGGGGGGGGRASVDLWAQSGLGPDFDEQIDAAYRAKLGRQTLADYEAGQAGEIAKLGHERAAGQQALYDKDNAEKEARINELYQMTHDYANRASKIDPWGGMSGGEQIAARVGAGLLTFGSVLTGGSASVGVDAINHIINRNIARQQAALEGQKHAMGVQQNLLQYFMETSKSKEEAFDKMTFVLTDAAMHDAAQGIRAIKGNIQSAEDDQFIAALKMQRDEAMGRIRASMSGGGSGVGAGGTGNFIPLEQGAGVVTGPDGQQYFLGHGSDKVAESIANSEQAAVHAERVSQLAKQMPNPLTSPQEYYLWAGQLSEEMKSTVVLGSNHLGSGGQGAIARMRAYQTAIAGPENDPKGFWGTLMQSPQMAIGQAQRIAQNAQLLAQTVRADNAAALQAHGAVPGVVRYVQAHGTGEFKGMGVTKQVFVPMPNARSAGAPPAEKKADPFARFKPSGQAPQAQAPQPAPQAQPTPQQGQ